jgi:hypothetical protein
MEPPNDRIAKRQAEIRAQQEALDREDADRRASDAAPAPVVDRETGGPGRSAVFLVVLVVVAAGLLGLAVTLSRLAGHDFKDAKREGTAKVTACVSHGPISRKGFGTWESCTATISWADGTTDRITAGPVFTSADIGNEVRVGDLGRFRNSRELVRADADYRPWLRWIGIAIGIIAFIPTLIAVLSIRALFRFRRR